MSVKVMTIAWGIEGLDPTQKLVLLKLADNANETDYVAFPSISTIAKQAGCSTRTVQRHLANLEQRGLIRRKNQFAGNGRQKVNLYYVLHPDLVGCQNDTPDTHVTPEGDTHDTPITLNRHIEPSTISSDRFDEFWDCFADKRGKEAARRVWKRKRLDNIADEVINGAKQYVKTRGTDRKYWKQAQGWLNDGRWADEPDVQQTSKPLKPERYTVFVEAGTPEWSAWREHDETLKPIQSSAGYGRWLPSKLPPNQQESVA